MLGMSPATEATYCCFQFTLVRPHVKNSNRCKLEEFPAAYQNVQTQNFKYRTVEVELWLLPEGMKTILMPNIV